jgi:DNA-binding transcriptional MerR regulator
LKIGDVAREIGVSVSTLRFYEQKALISPGRSEGGTRNYSDEDLERFKAIQAFSAADVSLDTLANLAAIRRLSRTGDTASKAVAAILSRQENAIEDRIRQLQSSLADLKTAQERLQACHGCRKRPTRSTCAACTVTPTLLACQIMHVVWDQEPA